MDNSGELYRIKNIRMSMRQHVESEYNELRNREEERLNRLELPYKIGAELDEVIEKYKKVLHDRKISIYFLEDTESFSVHIDFEGDQNE